jgi:hypothetical protein
MPALTLRLDDLDHDLLRLLSIVKRRSANQIITDLLRTEFDRELPGKRAAMQRATSDVERVREALALPPLSEDSRAEAALEAALDRAEVEADRIYGSEEQTAA